jgi:hypothetical protein
VKLDDLKVLGFQICNYQNILGNLSIDKWNIIIIQVESLFYIEFSAHLFVAIFKVACQNSFGPMPKVETLYIVLKLPKCQNAKTCQNAKIC